MTDESAAQGSAAWLHARCGKVTASRLPAIVTKLKSGGYSAERINYLMELVCERLTGRATEHYVTAPMQWGIDHEPQACAAYEFMADATTARVGFVNHPTIGMSGASPDRLAGDDGLVEFKCPTTRTHIETLLGGVVPANNRPQLVWQLACTGRAWCDFVSFDPRLPANLQFFTKRVERDAVEIAAMEAEVLSFLGELDAKISSLTQGTSAA
jgi:hypothetical protein